MDSFRHLYSNDQNFEELVEKRFYLDKDIERDMDNITFKHEVKIQQITIPFSSI